MTTPHPTPVPTTPSIAARAGQLWRRLTRADRGGYSAVYPEADEDQIRHRNVERVGHGGPLEGGTRDGWVLDGFWHHPQREDRH